ncbi:MAG: polysaccharide biosynthesis protein [Clostridia bacterium]|nr:polysaccharide biosynthesis protein [Clostridia bacterium]
MEKLLGSRKNETVSKEILSGAFSLSFSTIIVKILGLIYKIPLAGILGDEGMGFFNSAYTVYSFFYLLSTAGVPKAVMILVSEAKAQGNGSLEKRILSVSFRLFLIIGSLLCLVFIIFASPLSSLIGNNKSAATMIAIAPSIVITSLAGVIRGYLSADMCMLNIAVSQIIEGVGKLVCGLALGIMSSKVGMPLEFVSAFTILGVSIGAFAGFAYLLLSSKIKISREKSGQNERSFKIEKRIVSISLPITISAGAMSLTNIIDLGMIMRSLSSLGYTESEASALYGNYTTLAVPMLNLAMAIITPISTAFLPSLTKLYIRSDKAGERELVNNFVTVTMLIAAPLTLGMIVYSREILDILFPMNDTVIGGSLLCLLAPSIIFSSLLLVTNTALEAQGKVKAPIYSMLVGAAFKVILSYFLIRNPEIGISGAPIGTVVSYATALIVSSFLNIKYRGPCAGFLSNSVLFLTFASGSVFISRLLYNSLVQSFGELLTFVAAVFLCAALYFMLVFLYFYIRKKEQEKIAKYTKLTC